MCIQVWNMLWFQAKKQMGLNYTMMKVNKAELEKITFSRSDKLMKIEPVELSKGGVQLHVGDNFMMISQVPTMKTGNGNCIDCKFHIQYVHWGGGLQMGWGLQM